MEQDTTQILQNKVDKLKLLGLTDNLKNIIPSNVHQDDSVRDIALIKSLSAYPRIQRKILEIRGLEYDEKEKQVIKVAEERMNHNGARLVADILKTIAEETEWASFSEEEINSRIVHHFEENIFYILFNAEEYNLQSKYFGYIINMFQVIIDASFHKAKSGKYINTLGRTYDEGIMRRALDTGQLTKKQEEGFLTKYNPFKKSG